MDYRSAIGGVLILTGGASIDQLDYMERTPLHLAVMSGGTATVSLLLAGGACIDSLDYMKYTSLHFAVMGGHSESVSATLAGGASIDPLNDWKWTPLHGAACHGSIEIVSVRLAVGASIDSLNDTVALSQHAVDSLRLFMLFWPAVQVSMKWTMRNVHHYIWR